jgi:hypothetical protein
MCCKGRHGGVEGSVWMCFEGFYGVSMVLGVAGVLKSIGETSGVEMSQVASHWA